MRNGISIVIPNRNNDKYLKACISSVIGQIDREFVFIISDNHSSDNSMMIIDSYKENIDKIISPPKPVDYKEHLIWILEHVETEFVIFLAGDDMVHKELIHFYRRALENIGEINPTFVCSPFYYINESAKIYKSIRWPRGFIGPKKDMVNTFLKGPICNISSTAWRVDCLKEIHIPEEIGNSIDWYWYITLSDHNHVLLVNKKLLFYRVHRESTGNSNVAAHTDNCKRLFVNLKSNKFKNDIKKQKLIDRNIAEFNNVISGGKINPIRLYFKIIFYYLIEVFYKLSKNKQP